MPSRAKLTKRLVDSVRPSAEESRTWDTEIKGLVLRVFPDGRKSFALKYRIRSRQRWFTIGNFGDPWTVEEARARARTVLRAAEDGKDLQSAKEEQREAPTVAELTERYLKEGPRSKPNKRASSWYHDTSRLRRHVIPLIGKQSAAELKRKDVELMQADILEGKTAATIKGKKRGLARVRGGATIAGGVVRSFAAMMAWAVRDGIVPTNPCIGVTRVATPRRERYLSVEEIQAVLGAADSLARAGEIPQSFADAVRLLALTGARRTEILELRWSEVDLLRARIILPRHRSKTGEKSIPLNAASVDVLKRHHSEANGVFVFPGKGGNGPLVGVSKRWEQVRTLAEIPDLRMHDLRHSFASFAVADGASLFLVGKALGHTQSTTTERYAHLADDVVRKVAEGVAMRILGGKTVIE